MTTPDRKFTRFIGIDVGKDCLAVHDSAHGQDFSIDNTIASVTAWLTDTECCACTLIVCEDSGGYELTLLDCTARLKLAAHRASANKVKSYIASFGTLAKTDPGDARALARYGEERHNLMTLWGECDVDHRKLQALVLRRDDLLTMRVAEKNRLQAPGLEQDGCGIVRQSCEALIDLLNRQITTIEITMDQLIAASQRLTRKLTVLKTIKGIGQISAISIIAHMPEIGTTTRRKAASLAGLAPHPKDSGKTNKYRKTKGGRKALKRALFMPAMVAAQGNSPLSQHYNHLIKEGKKPIVAMTAIMRKIITIANAKVRDDIIQQQS